MWQKIELNYETYIKDIAGQSHEGRLLEIILFISEVFISEKHKKKYWKQITSLVIYSY